MDNLLTENWSLTNAFKQNDIFVLQTGGKMTQSINLPTDYTSYFLEYDCVTLTNPKSRFILRLTTVGGKHTYLVPVMFEGENKIEIELARDARTLTIELEGSLQIRNPKLYLNSELTESQKDAIEKVENDSDKWDRIKDVTNEQGNLITDRLEGSINNAMNAIFGGEGTMEIIDGTIMFRDKATDELSTMAMRINYGGIAIADEKKADGSWDWRTFGTGHGFTADYMNTGTLSAITIDGVTITATDITGGTVTGATIDGGTINGVTINGSIIYVGDKSSGNYIELSPNNPIKVWQNGKVVSSLGYSAIGGGNVTIYDAHGDKAFQVECLEDGDLEMFANNDNAMIPDPNNEGFFIPNPNPRKMVIKAGEVRVEGALTCNNVRKDSMYYPEGSGYYSRYLDEQSSTFDGKYAAKDHTHYTVPNGGHSHSISESTWGGFSCSTNGEHTHSISNFPYSDVRLKENIEVLDDNEVFEFLKKIDLVTYNFKEGRYKDTTLVGVKAQQLREHELGKLLTVEDGHGYYGVFYQFLATSTISAIRVLDEKNKRLEERLECLERMLEEVIK